MEARIAVLETKVEGLEKQGDVEEKTLQAIFDRLRTVERTIWLATGGVIAVGGIATFFGWSILKELAR